MHNYQRLQICELSLEIAKNIYAMTQGLSRSNRWNIGQQMNRAALSVLSNIAEGAGRGTESNG